MARWLAMHHGLNAAIGIGGLGISLLGQASGQAFRGMRTVETSTMQGAIYTCSVARRLYDTMTIGIAVLILRGPKHSVVTFIMRRSRIKKTFVPYWGGWVNKTWNPPDVSDPA